MKIENQKIMIDVFSSDGAMLEMQEEIVKKTEIGLNKLRPHVFNPEFVRGCNLRCKFCVTRTFPIGKKQFMTDEVWSNFIYIVEEVNPYGHIIFANVGEPTLHPKFCDLVNFARKKLPNIQMTVYTNGLLLINKEITYKDIFESGINSVYVDMYHPLEDHEKLAADSGYDYHAINKKEKSPVNVFLKQKNIDFKHIVLSPNPADWKKFKKNPKKINTSLNNIDFESASAEFNLTPVVDPPYRRCDQMQRTLNVSIDGHFHNCCLDAMNETAGKFQNVSDGFKGFLLFWFSEYMQQSRWLLYHKRRKDNPLCCRCNFISGRADIALWPENFLLKFYDGKSWNMIKREKVDLNLNTKKAFIKD